MKFSYTIKDLKLFGYHGVYNKEKKNGQFFLVNIFFDVNYNCKLDDNIDKVIDYTEICTDVASIFNERCDLLETLISNIKDFLEKKYDNLVFEIQITKMMPKINNNNAKSIKVKNIQ